MKIVIITAIAALILSPWALSGPASAQTPSGQQSVKKKKTTTVAPAPRHVSPSGNPEWDVYVGGVYVGSDPDPRIRYTLEREAKGGYGFRQ